MSLDMLILSSTVHPAVLLTQAHVRMKCFHFSIAECGDCWERCEQPGVGPCVEPLSSLSEAFLLKIRARILNVLWESLEIM